jgi:hypothetical protein
MQTHTGVDMWIWRGDVSAGLDVRGPSVSERNPVDHKRFDDLVQRVSRDTTRRTMLGAALALAGGLLVGQVESEAKPRGRKKRRRNRANAEVAINSCAKLCAVLPTRLRARCLAEAAASKVACECPSFCVRLHPGKPLKQLACLKGAAEHPQSSLCVACGADPDLACTQADGSVICRAANGCCQNSDCTGATCNTTTHACGSSTDGPGGPGDGGVWT